MDDRQLEAFRVARKFRTLLGHLNTIEWHQFFHYEESQPNASLTDDRLPPFGQFRKQLQNAFSYLPRGSRLIRAFEGLAVKTEPEWAPAKAAAWSRFHELCDYLGILRDHTGTPVLENTQSVIIVPGNRVKEFDFSICCDVQFAAFPEGAASFYECMRTGTCDTCGMSLTVTAIDTAVLNRVYRKCIVKERRVVSKPPEVAGFGVETQTRKGGDTKPRTSISATAAIKRHEVNTYIIAVLQEHHLDDNSNVINLAPLGLREVHRLVKPKHSEVTQYQVEKFFKEQFPSQGGKNNGWTLYAEAFAATGAEARLRKWFDNLDKKGLAAILAASEKQEQPAKESSEEVSKCDCGNPMTQHDAEFYGLCRECKKRENLPH